MAEIKKITIRLQRDGKLTLLTEGIRYGNKYFGLSAFDLDRTDIGQTVADIQTAADKADAQEFLKDVERIDKANLLTSQQIKA